MIERIIVIANYIDDFFFLGKFEDFLKEGSVMFIPVCAMHHVLNIEYIANKYQSIELFFLKNSHCILGSRELEPNMHIADE